MLVGVPVWPAGPKQARHMGPRAASKGSKMYELLELVSLSRGIVSSRCRRHRRIGVVGVVVDVVVVGVVYVFIVVVGKSVVVLSLIHI
mgnify:CR=1 FL=1